MLREGDGTAAIGQGAATPVSPLTFCRLLSWTRDTPGTARNEWMRGSAAIERSGNDLLLGS